MRLRMIALTAVVAASIGWFAGAAFTKDEVKSTEDKAKGHWEFHTPGEPHELFKRMVGTWDVNWSLDLGETQRGEGCSTNGLIYGGRYIVHKYRGTFLGKSNKGMGIMGYDNRTKKYQWIWIDSLSTGISRSEGTYNVETNELTMSGVTRGPNGTRHHRHVDKWSEDGTHTGTSYMGVGENEKQTGETKMKRRAPGAPKCP